MILGLALLLALLLRFSSGAEWREIGRIHIRGAIGLLCALILVAVLPAAAQLAPPLRAFVVPLWLLLMGVQLSVCALNFRQYQGFRVLAAGVALNLLVVAANAGMPVSTAAATSAGGGRALAAARAGDLFHCILAPSTQLSVLSDVLPLPGTPGLRAILSIGDVLMLSGILIVLVAPSLVPSRQ